MHWIYQQSDEFGKGHGLCRAGVWLLPVAHGVLQGGGVLAVWMGCNTQPTFLGHVAFYGMASFDTIDTILILLFFLVC